MGLSLFKPSGSSGPYTPPNPNPKNFEVKACSWVKRARSIVVLEVHYPGCTTFEGNKIMVFEGELKDFIHLPELDPHFTPTNKLLARFPATDEGLADALDYAEYKASKV